ncbi:MAG TPA: sulfotransferase domain-containing protein, partial [Acidimicrobiales bacterium]
MSIEDRAKHAFLRLPPGLRLQLLHRSGRYAPWEAGFDFTPPPLRPGDQAGPPDFVGIGVQKAGTTWWYELVTGHPGVWNPPGIHKERHFLDQFGSMPFAPSDVDRYRGWFPRPHGMIVGEWTPDYFSYPWAPVLLRRAASDTRLLLLLRDPVERLRSGLAHARRMGVRTGVDSFVDAFQRGFYHRALVGWLDQFDQTQLLVLQY